MVTASTKTQLGRNTLLELRAVHLWTSRIATMIECPLKSCISLRLTPRKVHHLHSFRHQPLDKVFQMLSEQSLLAMTEMRISNLLPGLKTLQSPNKIAMTNSKVWVSLKMSLKRAKNSKNEDGSWNKSSWRLKQDSRTRSQSKNLSISRENAHQTANLAYHQSLKMSLRLCLHVQFATQALLESPMKILQST